MAQVSLVGNDENIEVKLDLVKDSKPTLLLVALIAAEITIYLAIAHFAYHIPHK